MKLYLLRHSDAVRRAARDVVTDICVFDVYQGKGIEGQEICCVHSHIAAKRHDLQRGRPVALSDQIIGDSREKLWRRPARGLDKRVHQTFLSYRRFIAETSA